MKLKNPNPRPCYGNAWLIGSALCIAGVIMLGLGGCILRRTDTKTIIVQPGDPVQIREAVKGVKVWVFDAKGNRQETTLDIPAGWMALPDPGAPAMEPYPDPEIE